MPRGAYRTIARSVSLFGPHRAYVVSNAISLPVVNGSEIGNQTNATVTVIFSQAVTASNYSLGVTIKLDGVPVSISSAVIQDDHLVAIYTLSTNAKSNSLVNFIYSDVVGDYANNLEGALGPVNITVTNNVGIQARFNDSPNSMQLWHL